MIFKQFMIAKIIIILTYSLFAQEHFVISASGYGTNGYFNMVDATGLPTTFLIDSINTEISDLFNGKEIGIFDSSLCVGIAIWDGTFPFYITVWRGDESFGLEGSTSGNPIRFYLYSNNEGGDTVYSVESSNQSSGDYFPDGPAYYIEYLKSVEISTDFGCIDLAACNYFSNDAFIDDGSCLQNDCAGECGGSAVVDECGVCDGSGIADGACDCDGNALDECGVCDGSGIPNGACDCDGSELDECGVCGGNNETCEGCTYDYACNYDSFAIVDDGSCELAEELFDCDGNCLVEIDCAEVCGGTAELDVCEVCGGNGPAEGIDCYGQPLSLFNGLIPEDFSIHSIYPNPFNPVTNIIYGLPEHVNVQIVVYDLTGKKVATLINQFQTPGYHSINWNADNHPSGVYFVKIVAGDYINTQKLMLVK